MNYPHDKQAERSIIGAALIDGSIPTMVDLEPDDFYIQRNKWIWEAMQKLSINGGVDIITLTDELQSMGKLGDAGGPAYLTELVGEAITALYADDYAEIIREMSSRRKLLVLAQDMAKAAQDAKSNISDLGGFIDRLVQATRITGGAIHWGKFLSDLYDEIGERSKSPDETWGVPTGFSDFDKVTGGLQLSESLIISGNPGVGKSMLALQMGEQLAHSAPGAIYSIEMSGMAVIRRILSAQAKVPSRLLKSGQLGDRDWENIAKAIERLEKLPVYLSDHSNWTTTSLRADLSRLKIKHGIKWFVVDYLALLSDAGGMQEHERIGIISRNIKLICRHLDLAGVCIHSMTKAGMDAAVPKLTALRGESNVAFDADVVCFLAEYQDFGIENISKEDQANMRTLWFGKGRELENPRKYIHFVKSPDYPQFAEYAKENNYAEVYRG